MRTALQRVLTGLAALALVAPSQAAPLFPDVSTDHWAADAVRSLAARGMLEGYPDGTFKGDRAASRWEVAIIVARFLAKMEQEHDGALLQLCTPNAAGSYSLD